MRAYQVDEFLEGISILQFPNYGGFREMLDVVVVPVRMYAPIPRRAAAQWVVVIQGRLEDYHRFRDRFGGAEVPAAPPANVHVQARGGVEAAVELPGQVLEHGWYDPLPASEPHDRGAYLDRLARDLFPRGLVSEEVIAALLFH